MLLGRVTYGMWRVLAGLHRRRGRRVREVINNVPQARRSTTLDNDAALTAFELVEAQLTGSGAIIATYRPIR